jgi:hypothetical protein
MPPAVNCAIASFLAGFSYAFYPRYEIFTLAITNAAVMLYKTYESTLKEQKKEIPKVIQIINKLPLYHIIFMLPPSMLTQLRVVHPYYVNRAVKNFLSLGSNGLDEPIFLRAVSLFMGYKIK